MFLPEPLSPKNNRKNNRMKEAPRNPGSTVTALELARSSLCRKESKGMPKANDEADCCP